MEAIHLRESEEGIGRLMLLKRSNWKMMGPSPKVVFWFYETVEPIMIYADNRVTLYVLL